MLLWGHISDPTWVAASTTSPPGSTLKAETTQKNPTELLVLHSKQLWWVLSWRWWLLIMVIMVINGDGGHRSEVDLPAIDDNAAAWVDHQQQRSKMSSLWNGSRFNLFLIKISLCERRNWNSWNSLTFCNSDQQEVGEKGEEIAPGNNLKVLKFWKFNNFPW